MNGFFISQDGDQEKISMVKVNEFKECNSILKVDGHSTKDKSCFIITRGDIKTSVSPRGSLITFLTNGKTKVRTVLKAKMA